MSGAWTLTKEGRVARLLFDLPGEKVNTFTLESLKELNAKLDEVKDVDYLLIESGKKDSFIAGADLKQFETFLKDPKKTKEVIDLGHETFDKLQRLPSVAVIDGTCLGGGLELALACRWRIVTDNPKLKMGLPETSLGIIPGWGGTQRLPRVVGLEEGLTMILGGKQVDGKKALKIGLADLALASAFLKQDLLGALPKLKKNSPKSGFRTFILEKNPLGRALLFSLSKKETLKKTKGFYPAPLIALDLIKRTATSSLEKGLKEERETFFREVGKGFSIAPQLIYLFFAVEHLKKQKTEKAREVRSLGVIGSGLMGSGIAGSAALNGISVLMTDVSWDVINRGLGEIQKMLQKIAKRKKLSHGAINLIMHRVGTSTSNKSFINQDLVIEAATENLELKKKILADVESTVPKETILSTNTSSLKLSSLSDRLIGLHFFNPVDKMPLVEVVPGKNTSEEVIDTAVAFCKKLNQVPIVVKDCSGFLVNRLFAIQSVELMRLFALGASIEQLERVMTQFGWPMGPFTLADQVGLDTCSKVFHVMIEAYGDRFKGPNILDLLYATGALGKKSGVGFFLYEGNKKRINPKALTLSQGKERFTDEEILLRANAVMINEAALCLEEGIVKNEEELDAASVLGIGFPPFRGGIMRYAHEIGFKTVVKELESLNYHPAAYLLR